MTSEKLMNVARLRALLLRHEGLRLVAYDDVTGKPLKPGDTLKGHPTIGVGRALDVNGLSHREALFLLNNDIIRIYEELRRAFPWFAELDDVRKMVVISLAFNVGVQGVRGFKKMLTALALKRYEMAAAELLESKWSTQVGARARELAQLMHSGKFPELEPTPQS